LPQDQPLAIPVVDDPAGTSAGDVATDPILVPGKTCWQLVRAHRFALIVDADAYFRAAEAAMREARDSIMAIGWDFDLRINLRPDKQPLDPADKLGRFMQRLVADNPRLDAYILKWDAAMLQTIAEQIVPLMMLHWLTTPRLHFRLDSEHPFGACHHQKILVIDDSIAFCGGIDMTHDRWDTREHAPADDRRLRPDGSRYGPWHDVTTACDGPAARALGDLCRRRWQKAGGQRLKPPPQRPAPWPEHLPVALREVDIAIARTEPDFGPFEEVREIEALYTAAIRSARRTLYLESQYLASSRIADELAKRLMEPDGPEVVVVNPHRAAGWLEEWSMDGARNLVVSRLRQADRFGRFRIYYPVNRAGEAIYVHAKVVVMDDRLLRVGSSNLNNRSLGFDTECDIAIEAVPGTENAVEVAAGIRRFRNDLIAEHLGVDAGRLARTLEKEGSLIRAIEQLRRPEGRSLRLLQTDDLDEFDAALIETRVLDPERPGQGERRLIHLAKQQINRLTPAKAGLFGAFLAGMWLGRRLLRRR